MRDELGDLLFQVVFYAQLSREEGGFDFQDVAAEVTGKLLRRHPHVFPDGRLESFGREQELSAGEVVSNWEAIKHAERAQKSDGPSGRQSVLDGVPNSLPALEKARKLQQRAAGVGFDWRETAPVIDKLKEEVGEFEQALAAEDAGGMREELGDMLFALVNLSRHCKLDCESALRESNRRFEARFRDLEELAQERGWTLSERDLNELDQLWTLAKARIRDRTGGDSR